MACEVVVSGVGLVTPLGRNPEEVLQRIQCGEMAASETDFDADASVCPLVMRVVDFDAEHYFPENKMLRLMNRDAQFAVVAARLAMQDAGVTSDETYPSDRIGLFGSTGLTSLPMTDVSPLIQLASAEDGSLDLEQFGRVGLKRIRPVLSFKILANMPICFVSIFENIRGPNAVYTPWEGQGAQAIAAGYRAVRRGEVPCALVGGCDVKTRLLSFVRLEQSGALDSWREHGQGSIPGEGAAFLVLEERQHARRRGARILSRIDDYAIRSMGLSISRKDTMTALLSRLADVDRPMVIASGDGDYSSEDERHAMREVGLSPQSIIHPKPHLGNLYAAAAPIQMALGSVLIGNEDTRHTLVHCFGFGEQQAAFRMEAV